MSLPDRDIAEVVELARADLEALRGARVFVTGGTGFFGRWIVESWIRAQRDFGLHGELHLLSRNPEARASVIAGYADAPGVVFHRGDQASFDFPDGPFDAVIHAAVEHRTPSDTLLTNVAGTQRVLAFAAQANVKRLLYISSGAVYGAQPTDLPHVSEAHGARLDPLRGASAYGLAKGASEFLVAEVTRTAELEAVIARAFAFVGPGLPLDANYAIGNFIRDALGEGPIRVAGDGTPLRSYLYASDLAIWLWALLVRGARGHAYNVGSSAAVSIGDLARCVRDVLCPDREVVLGAVPDQAIPPSRYVPDVTKAMRELEVAVRVPLADAILRTAQWTRSRGASWA